MIVFEGVDNSGKSTLARAVASALSMNVQESEGPPKYTGELYHRAHRYWGMDNTLFVRHPFVSQTIYRTIRGNGEGIKPEILKAFYDTRPLFIYCDPVDRGLEGHIVKEGESSTHLLAIREKYEELLAHYRLWALKHAIIIYRIGDSINTVVDMVRGQEGR